MHFRLFIGYWKPHMDWPIIFCLASDVPGEVLTIIENQTWHTWAGEFVLSWSCVTWTYLEHKAVLGLQFDVQHGLLDIYQSPCPFCAARRARGRGPDEAPEDRHVIGHRLRALLVLRSARISSLQGTGHDQHWHRAQWSCDGETESPIDSSYCCHTLLNNKDFDCSYFTVCIKCT